MPLRVKYKLPIRPAAPRLEAAMAAVPSQLPVNLNVPYVQQEQNEWCWAACTQMIAAFKGNSDVKQCELANFLFGQTTCCQQPGSDQCNQPCPFEQVVPVYAHVNIQATFDKHPETMAVMLRELTAGRPVEVALAWYGGGGHVIIVQGVDEQGVFSVNDPYFGAGPVTYLGLLGAYGQGQWVVTYGNFR